MVSIIPAQMRASVLVGTQSLVCREVPTPLLEPGDVLVSIRAVGLCGSDVHFFEHGRVGDLVVERPLILGHEAAGLVVAVGPGVSDDRLGERVAVEPQRPCRRCWQCRAGRYNLCPDVRFPSAPPEHGAFAEYLALPSDFAHPIPDTMSYEEAALVEPLAVGVAATRKAGVVPGPRVLITGAGPIGVLTAAACRAFGAASVIAVDPSPSRRQAALAHGATEVRGPGSVSDFNGLLDAHIDTSGAREAIAEGLPTLRGAGRAVLVGMGASHVEVDLFLLQSRELQIEGLFRYVDAWPVAIHLVATGQVSVQGLVSDRGGLDDLPRFMRENGDSEVMKFVVDPSR